MEIFSQVVNVRAAREAHDLAAMYGVAVPQLEGEISRATHDSFKNKKRNTPVKKPSKLEQKMVRHQAASIPSTSRLMGVLTQEHTRVLNVIASKSTQRGVA